LANSINLISEEISFKKKDELFDLLIDLAGSYEQLLQKNRLEKIDSEEKNERTAIVNEVFHPFRSLTHPSQWSNRNFVFEQ